MGFGIGQRRRRRSLGSEAAWATARQITWSHWAAKSRIKIGGSELTLPTGAGSSDYGTDRYVAPASPTSDNMLRTTVPRQQTGSSSGVTVNSSSPLPHAPLPRSSPPVFRSLPQYVLVSIPSLVSAPSCHPFPQPSPPTISTLEKLIKTCPVWLQLGMSQERASLILHSESPGVFLVRKNMALKKMILSVRLSDQEGAPKVQEMLIKEEKSFHAVQLGRACTSWRIGLNVLWCDTYGGLRPETSSHSQLRLPQVVVQVTKYEDMAIISSLGSNFWGSSLNVRSEGHHGAVPACEIEACDGSARLWYVNPMLMEEYFKGMPGTATPPKPRTQSLSSPSQSQPSAPHPFANPPSRGRWACDDGTPPQMDKGGLKGEGSDGRRVTDRQRDSQRVGLGAASTPKTALSVSESTDLPLSRRPFEERLEEKAAMSAPCPENGTPAFTAATLGENDPRAEKPTSGDVRLSQVITKTAPPVPPPRRKKAAPAPPSLEGSDTSLHSSECGTPALCLDSCSNSSTEEEAERSGLATPTMRRSPTVILDRAKQRLSMVSLPQVFTRFMKAESKLHRRIVELARDRESYFGNLVRDYQTYTLETIPKHGSSTEMLQEIRQMLTQLKSYLIQSIELRTLQEAALYPEEKLEAIAEVALYKGMLKPIREAVYSVLRDIHTRDDSLRMLKENQQVVLNTTTTDLGITTSVPEAPVMEKIQQKMDALHQKYSPEEKISLLLKTCKIIYESMSVGCPGRPHGADDFLPVLMYVLVRCNIAALLLDVEYMMELMDPALQLGEGSYYLTTTYGALEHIKNYDRQPPTRQLSLEIQDSIHRWERRRTHNKALLSRSSVQDFINVSFPDAGADPKTLCVCPNTTVRDLCVQCAGKFEVADPESYGLWVQVEGEGRQLGLDELPLSVKSDLHYARPHREFCFVYRPERAEPHDTQDSAHPETA
ncbi:hypothetical protein SKAU_G00341740 [Synaphobranchus kaupii]|uniref:Ras and Rab interactor 3 n=1 Tax=Synaphobranchus kaupii TaxID=118154 RepID=A0A9Q1EN85_SYNKA|nr:hypothetical protein SKAU_G00341740 [Synaphobranchus kaupii]